MADTGLMLVGTGAHVTGSGDDWSNASNITAESSYASCTVDKGGGLSDYLRGTNLGFSVPPGATIDGIEVQINHEAEYSAGLDDELLYLVENGSIISGCDNKASGDDWGTSPATATYGGSTDTWNCSLNPAIVNSSTFGVQLIVNNAQLMQNQYARIYWIKVNLNNS